MTEREIADLEGSIAVRGVHIKFLEKENAELQAKLAAALKENERLLAALAGYSQHVQRDIGNMHTNV